jgi:hypothetical protein
LVAVVALADLQMAVVAPVALLSITRGTHFPDPQDLAAVIVQPQQRRDVSQLAVVRDLGHRLHQSRTQEFQRMAETAVSDTRQRL